MRAVIDTNVLLVANRQHQDVSEDCVSECVRRLLDMQNRGVTVIDDGFLILGEYQNKTNIKPQPGVGDKFLKWLLRNTANAERVELVSITETLPDTFNEFPDKELQTEFDVADRKFVAVSNAHPKQPVILQAADCKWLKWWPALATQGIKVDFLCPKDVCRFFEKNILLKHCPRCQALNDWRFLPIPPNPAHCLAGPWRTAGRQGAIKRASD